MDNMLSTEAFNTFVNTSEEKCLSKKIIIKLLTNNFVDLNFKKVLIFLFKQVNEFISFNFWITFL